MHRKKTASGIVGRGPVPRHPSRAPMIAGDRPPRYDENDVSPSVGQDRLILTRL